MLLLSEKVEVPHLKTMKMTDNKNCMSKMQIHKARTDSQKKNPASFAAAPKNCKLQKVSYSAWVLG